MPRFVSAYASFTSGLWLSIPPVFFIHRNHLESLPEWVCDSRKLEVLDVGHNRIRELPARWVLQTCCKIWSRISNSEIIADSVFSLFQWLPALFYLLFWFYFYLVGCHHTASFHPAFLLFLLCREISAFELRLEILKLFKEESPSFLTLNIKYLQP